MSMFITTGATIKCAFGTAPCALTATSAPTHLCEGKTIATIQDAASGVNISTFGLCQTLSNPQVAAATAAALGVLTPQPCVPVTQSWIPTGTPILLDGKPVLTQDSQCMCAYGGTIAIMNPGQTSAIAQ